MKNIFVETGYRRRFKLNRKVVLTCDHCKVLFARYPSMAQSEHHYCSTECHKAAQRLHKPEQE